MSNSGLRAIEISEFQPGSCDGWQFAPFPATLEVRRPDGTVEPELANLDGDRYHFRITDTNLSSQPDLKAVIKFSTHEPLVAEYIYFEKIPPPGIYDQPFFRTPDSE